MDTFDHRRGRELAIEGARIYVEELGDKAAPPLLLLHGGMGTIEDFQPLLPELGAGHRVVGVDSRGHGRSTLGKAKLSYRQLERDAGAVIEALELSRVRVLGFSDGGIVAYRLALSMAARIDQVMTIGAAPALPEDSPNRAIYEKVTAKGWREKFPETYDLYQRLAPEADFEALVEASKRMWLDDGASGYPGDAVERIAVPLLVMRGDDDKFFSRAEATALADRVKGARLSNLALATHVAFGDRPDAVAREVEAFLAAPESPPRA